MFSENKFQFLKEALNFLKDMSFILEERKHKTKQNWVLKILYMKISRRISVLVSYSFCFSAVLMSVVKVINHRDSNCHQYSFVTAMVQVNSFHLQ